jgi:hypothetical protein
VSIEFVHSSRRSSDGQHARIGRTAQLAPADREQQAAMPL